MRLRWPADSSAMRAMCGIAGAWGGDTPEADVRRMLAMLAHRGNDHEGAFAAGTHGAIGSRRLAIVDVAGGNQPLRCERERLALVANGEIYKSAELRSQLEQSGHRFATRSDCEAAVHLYEDLGERMPESLNGMYAIAIADGTDLFLARDPFGIKPLYMTGGDGDEPLRFASEMKPLSAFGKIRELAPGCTHHSARGERRFYAMPGETTPEKAEATVIPAITARLRELIGKSVRECMMSDGPVGVMLSGGFDSSVIAVIARRHTDKLHTFSVGAAGAPDLEAARALATRLGTIHHEYVFTAREASEALPEVIRHLESYDPWLVKSAIANWFCARMASDYVKVVLTGEGADELFGGYHYHKKYRCPHALHRELRRSAMDLHRTNLQRADRMSMAWGVEARVPYLSTELAEAAFAIAPEHKIVRMRPWKLRTEKWILRIAYEGMLPDRLLWRTKLPFESGSGVSATQTEILGPYVAGLDWQAYGDAQGKRFFCVEEAAFHKLLVSVLEHPQPIMDNQFSWARSVVRDWDGTHPATASRLRHLRWRNRQGSSASTSTASA